MDRKWLMRVWWVRILHKLSADMKIGEEDALGLLVSSLLVTAIEVLVRREV